MDAIEALNTRSIRQDLRRHAADEGTPRHRRCRPRCARPTTAGCARGASCSSKAISAGSSATCSRPRRCAASRHCQRRRSAARARQGAARAAHHPGRLPHRAGHQGAGHRTDPGRGRRGAEHPAGACTTLGYVAAWKTGEAAYDTEVKKSLGPRRRRSHRRLHLHRSAEPARRSRRASPRTFRTRCWTFRADAASARCRE